MIKILFLMVLLHCIDDFCLQAPSICKLKQKSSWETYSNLYRNDWIPALIIHALEWSIMIHLPLMVLVSISDIALLISILLNAIIHAVVDDMKCNRFKINLCIDQTLHLLQIILTLIILITLNL